MGYRVKILSVAEKALGKLDKPVRERALKFLRDELPKLENPRSIGAALSGSKLGEFWKYRRGSLRFICQIEDEQVVILVVKIGDRKEVYKKK
jgi:mRNA interferase RelE/StbE